MCSKTWKIRPKLKKCVRTQKIHCDPPTYYLKNTKKLLWPTTNWDSPPTKKKEEKFYIVKYSSHFTYINTKWVNNEAAMGVSHIHGPALLRNLDTRLNTNWCWGVPLLVWNWLLLLPFKSFFLVVTSGLFQKYPKNLH